MLFCLIFHIVPEAPRYDDCFFGKCSNKMLRPFYMTVRLDDCQIGHSCF